MALPLLFIGVAATTGTVGVGKTIKAGIDVSNAQRINKNAKELIDESTKLLNAQRLACGRSLQRLGEEKLYVLNSSVTEFLATFTRMKNVDFSGSIGLNELYKLHLDEKEFEELQTMVNFAGSVGAGVLAGTASGALTAFGAYGAAQTLACASTGTAIASLSGAAATNATLAFFGGGSIASGGLGIAGGTAILGGLVAGPALMVMGIVAGTAAKKNLESAYTNMAEAVQIAEQHSVAALQCEAIRRRTYVFYNLLARLDACFLPLIYKMEDICKAEGDDYKLYSANSKKVIASCASIAVTVKTLLDTSLLADDGLLTNESEQITIDTDEFLNTIKE